MPELELQEVGEQVVVPVPLASRIERNEEQVASLNLAQHRRGIAPAEDGVAKRRRESVEYRCAQQELSVVGIEGVEHLACEVVGDMAVIACKLLHPRPLVVEAAKPERGQVQASRPSLGSVHQPFDGDIVKLEALEVDE